MTKHKHEKHRRTPQQEAIDVRHPYWQRAHRDWRFLAVVFLMLAAMVTYVMAYGLVGWPHGQVLPLLDTSGK